MPVSPNAVQPNGPQTLPFVLGDALTFAFRLRYDDEMHAGAALQGLQVGILIFPPFCLLRKNAETPQAYRITEEMALKISCVASPKRLERLTSSFLVSCFSCFADSPRGEESARVLDHLVVTSSLVLNEMQVVELFASRAACHDV